MTFYDSALRLTANILKEYGITYETIVDNGFNNAYEFITDYDMFDKYCPEESKVYDSLFYLIEERVTNECDFTDKDFEYYLNLALKKGYDEFKENEERYGYEPVELPDTEEEFYDKLDTDKEFYEDMMLVISDAVIIDWPWLGICILHTRKFYDDLENRI